MNRNRKIKEDLVQSVKSIFNSSNIVIITHNKGLTVSKIKELRKSVKQLGGGHVVAKNTLVKIAMQDTKFAELSKLMVGPTAITYSSDVVGAAKSLCDFSKQSDKIDIVGGMMDGVYLTPDAVKTLASLPSLDELRSRLIGLIAAPATKIARILQTPGTQVARVISEYSKK